MPGSVPSLLGSMSEQLATAAVRAAFLMGAGNGIIPVSVRSECVRRTPSLSVLSLIVRPQPPGMSSPVGPPVPGPLPIDRWPGAAGELLGCEGSLLDDSGVEGEGSRSG